MLHIVARLLIAHVAHHATQHAVKQVATGAINHAAHQVATHAANHATHQVTHSIANQNQLVQNVFNQPPQDAGNLEKVAEAGALLFGAANTGMNIVKAKREQDTHRQKEQEKQAIRDQIQSLQEQLDDL